MTHEGYIVVPSGLTPAHSFDLWGPLVDQGILGAQKAGLFREAARRENIPKEVVRTTLDDYAALMRGDPSATGLRKRSIVAAIQGPIERHPDLLPDYGAALQSDAVAVLRDIYGAREGALIFSSRQQPEIYEPLARALGMDTTELQGTLPFYAGGKAESPEAFTHVMVEERKKRRRMVSHTADELPELAMAVASGWFSGNKGCLVYVDRGGPSTKEDVQKAGIDRYVQTLGEVGYTNLVASAPGRNP